MKTFNEFLSEEEKASKETAHYQDHPKGKEHCSKCTMWKPPHGCTAVKGKISPDGWCKYYENKKD